jgi:hypothetical protein
MHSAAAWTSARSPTDWHRSCKPVTPEQSREDPTKATDTPECPHIGTGRTTRGYCGCPRNDIATDLTSRFAVGA